MGTNGASKRSATTAPDPARGTQAIDRATSLIALVVRADEPLSFVEIQEECGLPKSTTSRLLAALERNDLIERDDAGNYSAGSLFWLYAARHDPFDELARLARPTLVELGESTRETVHLAMARDDRVVHVEQIDSQFMLGMRDWTQADVPPHTSALGKVFYAHGRIQLPRRQLARLTPRTTVDPAVLTRQLETARQVGWATTVDELEVGLTGVAVPLRGAQGDVIAAIGVSGPTSRMADRIDVIGQQLTDRAEQLSGLLSRRNWKEGAA